MRPTRHGFPKWGDGGISPPQAGKKIPHTHTKTKINLSAQVYDMVNPHEKDMIKLRDVKNCKLAANFFDTFFNLEKWLEHEQKDPFQLSREDGEEVRNCLMFLPLLDDRKTKAAFT